MSVYNFKKTAGTGGGSYKGWKTWRIGEWVIGEVTGHHTDKFRNVSPVVKVLDSNFAAVGTSLNINSCGGLKDLLSRRPAEIGDVMRFEYKGMTTVTKGQWKGTECHNVDVMFNEAEEVEDDGSDL
jgi:hypothetical protein